MRIFLHLLIAGIGLGVLTGTTLKIFAMRRLQGKEILPNIFTSKESGLNKAQTQNRKSTSTLTKKFFLKKSLSNQKEISELSNRWEILAAKHRDLEASAFLYLLDDDQYAELAPNRLLPAASSIKTAILVVALQMVDAGQLRWDEKLKLNEEVIGSGAGWMAYQPIGKTFPTHEVAIEMIRISDNTATNLLIQRIGGIQILNEQFKALGLTSTSIKNWLPDLKGTNTTSTKDLTRIIAIVDSGNVLSNRSRDLFREVMSTSTSNRLLPGGLLKGLGGASQGDPDYRLLIKGYRIYNKTGDIGIAYSDAGLIELPNTKRAVAGFIVKGPFNDPRSPELIRAMAAAMAPVLRANPSSTN